MKICGWSQSPLPEVVLCHLSGVCFIQLEAELDSTVPMGIRIKKHNDLLQESPSLVNSLPRCQGGFGHTQLEGASLYVEERTRSQRCVVSTIDHPTIRCHAYSRRRVHRASTAARANPA